MKVPPHLFQATVAFYRDVLGLRQLETRENTVRFEFGANHLWIDRVPGISQAETWLELVTNDVAGAEKLLAQANVIRCDEIEPLPEGFQAFWIMNPAQIVHLVGGEEESG